MIKLIKRWLEKREGKKGNSDEKGGLRQRENEKRIKGSNIVTEKENQDNLIGKPCSTIRHLVGFIHSL